MLVWFGWCLPEWRLFCWTVVAGKVSTADSLWRGMMYDGISDICVMSRKAQDLTDHLFLLCGVASQIWSHFLHKSQVQHVMVFSGKHV